jgi:hypothetical protein
LKGEFVMQIARLASLALVALAILLGLALLGVALAHAGEGGGIAEAMFDRMDANRDGVLTQDEIKAARGRLFDRMDADRDGTVTSAEMEAARETARKRGLRRFARLADLRAGMPSPAERFEALDRNKDGKLTREEFAEASPLFDRISQNGGAISKAEFRRFLDAAR